MGLVSITGEIGSEQTALEVIGAGALTSTCALRPPISVVLRGQAGGGQEVVWGVRDLLLASLWAPYFYSFHHYS